ncbi:MAG: hypothetical protein RIQ53_4192 [Pseudomonadota bacterium]|jgi:ParB/RepB/Spo0J family partition protein
MMPTSTTPEQIIEIPLHLLHDSPWQHRSEYDEAHIAEIAASIVETGRIHQPMVIRLRYPNPLFRDEHVPSDGYELVFGHTRLRAARRAGLTTAPCVLRTMSDAQVRAAQLAENLARRDVHPLDEAEGYQQILSAGDMTAEELGRSLGKSRSHIYARLRLLDLAPEVRTAVRRGDIVTEVGLLIARVGAPVLQRQALAEVRRLRLDTADGGRGSVRAIRDLLSDRYTLDLGMAPWPQEDHGLVVEAGACVICPKRSGNAPAWADIVQAGSTGAGKRCNVGPDVCTDAACYASKKAAFLAREAQRLSDEGDERTTVLQGKAALEAIEWAHQRGGPMVLWDDAMRALAAAHVLERPVRIYALSPVTCRAVPMTHRRGLDALLDAAILARAPAAAQGTPVPAWPVPGTDAQQAQARAAAAATAGEADTDDEDDDDAHGPAGDAPTGASTGGRPRARPASTPSIAGAGADRGGELRAQALAHGWTEEEAVTVDRKAMDRVMRTAMARIGANPRRTLGDLRLVTSTLASPWTIYELLVALGLSDRLPEECHTADADADDAIRQWIQTNATADELGQVLLAAALRLHAQRLLPVRPSTHGGDRADARVIVDLLHPYVPDLCAAARGESQTDDVSGCAAAGDQTDEADGCAAGTDQTDDAAGDPADREPATTGDLFATETEDA